MGLVSQEPALFATSIKENILSGKKDATIDDVVEAAKASDAHTFISQLPNVYDSGASFKSKYNCSGCRVKPEFSQQLLGLLRLKAVASDES
ncbi:hypothetical protein YC2023_041128 [Brassica napus]